MPQRNCIRTQCKSPFTAEFFYFDIPNYAADEIFARFDVVPKFYEEYQPQDSRYVLIRCRVKRQQVHAFLEVMEELGRKMLLTGYDDYYERCEEFMSKLEAYASGEGGSSPEEVLMEDELMRADIDNLCLYLNYIKVKYPDIFAELEDHFDGLPGFTERSLP